MNTTEILARLQLVKPTGDHQWIARCPAHNDKTPSLSITEAADGKTLLRCHAGCDTPAIVAAIALTVSDLFPDKPQRNGAARQIVAEHSYQEENGNELFQVVRYFPKDFRQRRKVNGKWVWNLEGVKRVLYRLPEITHDLAQGFTIFVCEGEKDVEEMVKRGLSATCNSGGAGKWEGSYSETLRGADVVIIADKDDPGRKHARLVATKLDGKAKRVRVIELPDVNGKPVKDAHDFFTAGGTAEQVVELANALPDWKSAHESETSDLATEAEPTKAIDLPPILDAADFLAETITMPAELVYGLLHQGSKLVLGGGSKTFKTWTLLDLAVSIAAGEPWLSLKTAKGKVLYVNFELPSFSFQQRLQIVAKEKGITIKPGMVDLWNLRGQAASYHDLFPKIRERIQASAYVLIILDPIYKIYGSTDENSAGQVAMLLNAVEQLTVDTGAAVAFGAHYAKGNAANKEAIDRISGSGVFARDPDTILNFTKHEQDDAFSVEATLRNFKPLQPFVVRWIYPLMRRDHDLDPSKLKQAGGAQKKYSVEMLADALRKKPITTASWQKKTSAECGMSRRTFYDLLPQAAKLPRVKKTQSGQWFRDDSGGSDEVQNACGAETL